MREAIPVGRFSSDKQAEGDSEARQANCFQRLLHQYELRQSTRFAPIFDRGRSAFKGEHLEGGKLGDFLARVKAGEVKPDASGLMPVLCFEAVDRLTRLEPDDAIMLLRQLVKQYGFALAFDEMGLWIDKDTMGQRWIELNVAIKCAWDYSKRLQRRIQSAWKGKRDKGQKTTTVCPCWIRWDGQKFVLNDFAPTLKAACLDSIGGLGATEIIKRRNLPLRQANLAKLFRKIELMGHHQHKTRHGHDRKAAGEIITDYYPPLLTEGQFADLQQAIDGRKRFKGRRGKLCTNLFTDLLFDTSEDKLIIKGQRNGKPPVLISQATRLGTLRYQVIEDALLSLFVRLTKNDLAPVVQLEDNTDKLKGKLKMLRYKIDYCKEKILCEEGEFLEAMETMEGLSKQARQVEAELAEQKAKHPAAETLNECQDAIDYLAGLEGAELLDARIRAKTLIRQLVRKITVEVWGNYSAGLTVVLADGTVHKGETGKIGGIQVTLREGAA